MLTQTDLINKIQKLQAQGQIDLSTEEDLSLAIMNLVSLEEHFFFSAEKTGKGDYFDLLNQVRDIRKTLLAKMIPQNEGETWCVSKHLLAATMRLVEVGTKLYSDGKKNEAKETFDKAYELYNTFWALRLRLINTKDLKQINDGQLNIHDSSLDNRPWSKQDIVNKLLDCCKE